MKKITALVLLISVLLLVCSCGCEPVELLSFIDETAGSVVDCEGKVFNFATPSYGEWYLGPDDEGVPTLTMERMMNRYDECAKKFNMEFEASPIDQTTLTQLFATGDDIPEMLYISSCYAYDLYKMGILASLNDVSTIDMNDSKWGDHDYISYGKYDGKQFGFIPWNWQFVPQYCGAVIFNGEMIKEYGGTDPYEMKENGLWNWENWEAELEKYSGVGVDGIQRWGALLSTRFAARGAILSNGGNIVELKDDGSYEFRMNSPESLAALEFLAKLTSEGLVNDNDLVKDGDMAPFTRQNLAPFFVGESWYGTVLGTDLASSTLTHYGYMPFPTGPNGDPEKDAGSYMYMNGLMLYITSMADIEVENIGSVVDYMFEPLEDTAEEAWKDYLDSTIFSATDHDKCLENFVFAIENMKYDYSAQLDDGIYSNVDRTLEGIVSGTKTAAEAAASLEGILMGAYEG
ncbi:MAG: hypothetical protein IJE51_03210 [Clostridia bacterium]|nr:hypothetical protein [Clostridia bacterium]